MKRILIALILLHATVGSSAPQETSAYILKSNLTWDRIIEDPFEWSRQQLREAAPIGRDGRLCCSEADVDGDEIPELFIHADVASSLFVILTFKKVTGGHQYLGNFCSNPNMIIFPKKNQVMTYQRCGGHNGTIVTYTLNTNCFEITATSGLLSVGDGGVTEDNEQVRLLSLNCKLTWKKVPNQTVQSILVPPATKTHSVITQNQQTNSVRD